MVPFFFKIYAELDIADDFESQLDGIAHRHHRNNLVADETFQTTPGGGFGNAQPLGDGDNGHAAILLQQGDHFAIDAV